MKKTASQGFHQPPERYNCAQAVIHAYRSVSGDEVHQPEQFKNFGGGRAPEGICGALFAACQVGMESAKSLAQCFEERTGARTCKELKSQSVPCKTCVETAAELLEESLMGEASERIRIAVPMWNDQFSDHFGGSSHFLLIDANRNTMRIFRQTEATAQEDVPGAFPEWLADRGVHCVIASSIGKQAVQGFAAVKIPVFIATEGASPAELVSLQLEGRLIQSGMENGCMSA